MKQGNLQARIWKSLESNSEPASPNIPNRDFIPAESSVKHQHRLHLDEWDFLYDANAIRVWRL